MKTVVIGCGNVGVKRINAIQNISEIEITALVEINSQQKQYLEFMLLKNEQNIFEKCSQRFNIKDVLILCYLCYKVKQSCTQTICERAANKGHFSVIFAPQI